MLGDRTRAEQARFESLCAPLRVDVFRMLYRQCRDASLAEDVTQETLLRAWKSLSSLSDEKSVGPWLFAIARRELARTYKRKRVPTVDLDFESEGEAFGVSEDFETQEMWRAIPKLDTAHQEVIARVMLGYSTKEIAQHLRISLPAVLTRLYRARHALREHMLGEAASRGTGE